MDQIETQVGQAGIGLPLPAVGGGKSGQRFGVVPLLDPTGAQARQAAANVNLRGRVGVGTGTVVDVDGRVLVGGTGLGDLAHGHADVLTGAGDVDLSRTGEGFQIG